MFGQKYMIFLICKLKKQHEKNSWINEVVPEVMNIFIGFYYQKIFIHRRKVLLKKNHTIQKAK